MMEDDELETEDRETYRREKEEDAIKERSAKIARMSEERLFKAVFVAVGAATWPWEAGADELDDRAEVAWKTLEQARKDGQD